jgi:Holliday junction resolvase RusA-like endonuclease
MAYPIFRARVYGEAGVQGSKSAFVHPKTKKAVMIEGSKGGRDWRQTLIKEMINDSPEIPYDEAVFMRLNVYVMRPSGHYKPSGGLRPSAPKYPMSGKDLDKIQRSVGDAAKIAKWVKDDSRIAKWEVNRIYLESFADIVRVEIAMYSLEEWGLGFLDKFEADLAKAQANLTGDENNGHKLDI